MLSDFHFIRPLWLGLLPLLVPLLWALARIHGAANAWRDVVDATLLPHLIVDDPGGVRRWPLVILALAWTMGVLALAGPTWRQAPQPVHQVQQFRVIALDLSPSMQAGDLAPSRLTRARFKILDLLTQDSDGQTALLAYGAEPYVVSPLTTDVDTIAVQVPELETALLPVQGAQRTDLVLQLAGDLLTQAGAPEGQIILVTAGLDQPAATLDAARSLRSSGYRVSVLGVGTEKGAPVSTAEGGFALDEQGAIRLYRLQPAQLQQLAKVGGGRFVLAAPDDRDIKSLAQVGGARRQAEQNGQDRTLERWHDDGPWLLLVILPIAAVAFRRGWFAPLMLVVFIAPPSARALTWQDLWLTPDQQGARAYASEDPDAALQKFARRDWRAAAAYAAGNYQQALDNLNSDPGDAAAAAYNRGNSLARLGQLRESLVAYDAALAQDPDDADARHNRDLVQRLLDEQQSSASDGQQSPAESGDEGAGEGDGQSQSSSPPSDTDASDSARDAQDANGDRQQAGADQAGQANQLATRTEQQQTVGTPKQDSPAGAAAGTSESDDQQTTKGSDPLGEPSAQGDDAQQSDAPLADDNQRSTVQGAEGTSSAPGLKDLLGDESERVGAAANETLNATRLEREDDQALDQMLRRVEDDPGGLLRQRFLLQHLRRAGRLP